jgi:hypothetical protein
MTRVIKAVRHAMMRVESHVIVRWRASSKLRVVQWRDSWSLFCVMMHNAAPHGTFIFRNIVLIEANHAMTRVFVFVVLLQEKYVWNRRDNDVRSASTCLFNRLLLQEK